MRPDVNTFPSYVKDALILALEFHDGLRAGSLEEALIRHSDQHTGEDWSTIGYLIRWELMARTTDRRKVLHLTGFGIMSARQLSESE